MSKKDDGSLLGMMSPQKWSLALTLLGVLVLSAGLFTPRWRADDIGTAHIEENWQLFGFPSKTYGLIGVKGSYQQSWTVAASTTCQYRTGSAVVAGITTLIEQIQRPGDLTGCGRTSDSSCESDPEGCDACTTNFFRHMQVRCEEYERMQMISSITLAFSCLAVFMASVGLILGIMSKARKVGGIVLGICVFAGIFAIITNLVWAWMSDRAFKTIAESAYYPYPSLAIGWFLHLYGGVTIVTAMIWYGLLVMPDVMTYDPVEAKIGKKERKLRILKAAAAQEAAVQQQGMAGQQAYYNNGGTMAPGNYGPGAMHGDQQYGAYQGQAALYGQTQMPQPAPYGQTQMQMPQPTPYGQPQTQYYGNPQMQPYSQQQAMPVPARNNAV